jgi:hypothetical protein
VVQLDKSFPNTTLFCNHHSAHKYLYHCDYEHLFAILLFFLGTLQHVNLTHWDACPSDSPCSGTPRSQANLSHQSSPDEVAIVKKPRALPMLSCGRGQCKDGGRGKEDQDRDRTCLVVTLCFDVLKLSVERYYLLALISTLI